MFTNVFYQKNIFGIGGVETFLYELARLSYDNNRDLTIFYTEGDSHQIERLEKYCRTININTVEKPIKCKTAFFNYCIDAINDFDAENYVQLVHADFKRDPATKSLKLIQSDKINQYYGVSKNTVDSFIELTNKHNIDVLYNPITLDDEPRVMTLISAQRMVESKGSKRIEEFIKRLDDAKIPYVWHIFADNNLSIDSPNVMYHKPTLDIRRWIKYADYMVLLSDSEGFAYGLYESLCLGTPIITTPLYILNELGANNTNSIVVDFDMSNLDVLDIYNRAGKFNFKYTQKSTKPWLKLLTEPATYTPPKYVKLICKQRYYDIRLNSVICVGTIYEVPENRASLLIDKGFAEQIE